jgi:hypothetical protein
MLDIQKVVKNMRAELVSHSMLARRGVWAKQFLFFFLHFSKKAWPSESKRTATILARHGSRFKTCTRYEGPQKEIHYDD